MVRVTVEMLPHGDESKRYLLGVADIANDGTGTITHGNYVSSFRYKDRVWATLVVRGFPRKSRNVWYLLYECLREAVKG